MRSRRSEDVSSGGGGGGGGGSNQPASLPGSGHVVLFFVLREQFLGVPNAELIAVG